MLQTCLWSVTAAPLCVSTCIFDADECFVAMYLFVPIDIFLKLFKLFLKNL